MCKIFHCLFLFCSLAVLNPRVGHTMDVLSPFIPVLCHSDWLFHGESCPRLDVHPGRAWPSSPACTWHCSLHYLFLQATPLFPHCHFPDISIFNLHSAMLAWSVLWSYRCLYMPQANSQNNCVNLACFWCRWCPQIILRCIGRNYFVSSEIRALPSGTSFKTQNIKIKVAHTRLPSVGFQRWSRFLAVSLQVTWVINPAVGCHYFPLGVQLPCNH